MLVVCVYASENPSGICLSQQPILVDHSNVAETLNNLGFFVVGCFFFGWFVVFFWGEVEGGQYKNNWLLFISLGLWLNGSL